jgi:hypothetical protein
MVCSASAKEPMSIVELPKRGNMNKNDFVSDKRLYLDKDGKVVGDKDPNKLTLLVSEGGSIPFETAEKYGLTKVEEAAVEEEEGEEANQTSPKKAAAPKANAKAPARKK